MCGGSGAGAPADLWTVDQQRDQTIAATRDLVRAAHVAIASRRPCPDTAFVGMRCPCWHCDLRRTVAAVPERGWKA